MRVVLPIAAVVSASAALRYAASRSFEAPWIAPDEMIYGLLGRSLWATGAGSLIGGDAPFYGGYPLLVGLPLHALDAGAAVSAIQLGQAILMSLAAAAAWAWCRPLAGDTWALVAAALTACLPALAYSGLLMSEAAFLPAATLALWMAARALTRPSPGRQAALLATLGLATAARLQGVILVPVARDCRASRSVVCPRPRGPRPPGSHVDRDRRAGRARDRRPPRSRTGTSRASLVPTAVWSGRHYDAGEAARWIFYHVGDLFLLVLGVPLVALGVLGYGAARGRESDPGVRALVAVSLATSLWLPVQVGVFASRYVGHLAERDLIIAAPPLFVCLAVWLSRGVPRPQPATSIIAFAVAIPAVFLPIRALATPDAAPDAFMMFPFARLLEETSAQVLEVAWMTVAVLLVAAAAALPRRAAALLPVFVALGLVATSVVASSEVGKLTRIDDDRFFGTASRTWVDDAATAAGHVPLRRQRVLERRLEDRILE